SRDYQLEVKLGLAWGKPAPLRGSNQRSKYKDPSDIPQELHLPLHFSSIQVFSGLAPPAELVEAMRQNRGRTSRPSQPPRPFEPQQEAAPHLPPRPAATQQQSQQQPPDALYPPQLQPGQVNPPYDDAPPTYEEAMAEEMTGPMIPSGARPAYSGVTNENAPSSLPPQKN
ncbi:hypothetical protein C8A05DRAFT_16958, partial [Staphylotrichum tortipilum]